MERGEAALPVMARLPAVPSVESLPALLAGRALWRFDIDSETAHQTPTKLLLWPGNRCCCLREARV